jgi:hypothetical protein
MHEMIYAFLYQYACHECATTKENTSNHGRAFQILAKAIEEQCPRLLGLQFELGRMDGIIADTEDEDETLRNSPSAHDLEMYGFMDPSGYSDMADLVGHISAEEVHNDSGSKDK